GPDALAGIILINPSPIKTDRKLNGSLFTVVESNGRSGVVNAQLEGGLEKTTYRVGLTRKKSGNIKSADYYLGNTGLEELNFQGMFGYHDRKNTWELSYNHFGNTLGVFEGAHIGSKEDIMARIAHGRPFEEYSFSYSIHTPKQKVQHDLAKVKWHHEWHEHLHIESIYSVQRNHRKEYDLRRVESDNTPMADMVLTTQALEVLLKTGHTTLGMAGSLQVNNNIPGTGTTPIIPNYDNHTLGIFATQKYYWGSDMMELGLRYDYKYFDVAGYRYDYQNPNGDGSLNQYLLTDQRHFNNLSGIAGVSIAINKHMFWKSHVGLAWRAPSANELYSDGIHHGTGTYEIGDPNLKSEKGIKWVNTLHFDNEWLVANSDIFVQSILDYSYAQPNPDSLRQTIRGTFPLFQYRQTNAFLYGMDLNLTAILHEKLEYAINISTVVGRNAMQQSYLPYMPSDRVQQSFLSRLSKNAYIRLNHLFVAKQHRYEEGTDYISPPPSYHLFGLVASYSVLLRDQQRIGMQIGVENLLNRPYKDYMDRFRYYAHLQGRNVSLKLNYNF
ncbi:MAG TPA: TonB-dependent receptor, partial [Sphingobacterium sp.]|nr:TonB-dependent receptor [Sphingobacterium sp.]